LADGFLIVIGGGGRGDRRNPGAAIYLTTDEDSSPEIQFEEGQRCIEWTCSRSRKCPGVPRLLTTKQICGRKM